MENMLAFCGFASGISSKNPPISHHKPVRTHYFKAKTWNELMICQTRFENEFHIYDLENFVSPVAARAD